MPHITIEHSSNVAERHDIDALVRAVHDAALATGLPPADGLRTRAVETGHYLVATGDDDLAYVAITARIGPGRAPQAKTGFLRAILDAAEAALASDGHLAIAYSGEVQEIDAEFRINRNHVRTRLAERTAD